MGASIAHASCALSTEKQPQGLVGLQLFTPDDASAWADADELGVIWIRIEIRWDWIEPYQRQFDSSYADKVFTLAAAHPKRLMLLFNHPPVWAANAPDRLPVSAAAAITWLMKKYGNQVAAVEVFNEPNLPGLYGWPNAWTTLKDSAIAYANTLTAVSSAIREIDKKVFVISGGLSPTRDPEAYLRWIVRVTPPDCLDSIGLHPYGQTRRFESIQNNVAALLKQEQRPRKNAWFTEFGTDQDSQRTALLTSLSAEKNSSPITFFFADRDFGWLFTETYGLRRKDGSPKIPDYAVFKRIMSE